MLSEGEFPEYGGSALLTAVGSIEERDQGELRAALRSWVVDWTHRIEVPAVRQVADQVAAPVRRLVEAVVDVLLERRPAEQVRRWVSREVFVLLSTVAHRRAAARFAARSMVRSIRLHVPAPDAVESTVLVQDGPRGKGRGAAFRAHGASGRGALPG